MRNFTTWIKAETVEFFAKASGSPLCTVVGKETESHRFLLIGGGVMLLLGTLGNGLVIAVSVNAGVLSQANLIYAMALAIGNLGCLYTGLLQQFLLGLIDMDIEDLHWALCGTLTWLRYSFQYINVWTMVAFNVERVIRVIVPSYEETSWYEAILFCWIIYFTNITVNLWHFRKRELRIRNGCSECLPKESSIHYETYIWPWVNFIVDCLAPFLIFLLSHGIMLRKMWKLKRFYQELEAAANLYIAAKRPDEFTEFSLDKEQGAGESPLLGSIGTKEEDEDSDSEMFWDSFNALSLEDMRLKREDSNRNKTLSDPTHPDSFSYDEQNIGDFRFQAGDEVNSIGGAGDAEFVERDLKEDLSQSEEDDKQSWLSGEEAEELFPLLQRWNVAEIEAALPEQEESTVLTYKIVLQPLAQRLHRLISASQLLLMLDLFFLLLTAPKDVYLVLSAGYSNFLSRLVTASVTDKPWHASLLYLLAYANNALLWVGFVFNLKQFRQQLKDLFTTKKKTPKDSVIDQKVDGEAKESPSESSQKKEEAGKKKGKKPKVTSAEARSQSEDILLK